MKKQFYPFLFLFCYPVWLNAQCPKGFTEKLSHNTAGGGTAFNFQPALNIRACVENKPGLLGQQIFWGVRAYFHNYKNVKFTKIIKLTCGDIIRKEVTIYNLKKDEFQGGGSFAGDIDLSDNIFKEACNNPNNRIASVSVGNVTCELADNDPLVQQEQSRLAKIELDRKATAEANRKAQELANARAAQAKEDQDKKMAAQEKARAEATAKRQAEIDRINAENAMRMAEYKAKQERLDNAMRTLQSDMAANNLETEDKLAQARAKNRLDADNSGTISDAKNILNSAKVTASEVFGNALNSSGNGYTEEDKTSMSNMGAAYNDYERSGGEDYNYGKKIASKIFGFFSPKQDTRIEDIPENGYSSADESVSRTSKISNLFASVKEKLSWLKPTLPSGMLIDQYKASLDQIRIAENGGDPINAEYIGQTGGRSIGNFIGMGIVGAGIWGASTIITTTVVTTAPAIAVGAAVYLLYNEGKKLKNFIAEKQEL